MTRHIFKLVWNRKRSTGLILLEIMICFLVLCGILSAGINLAQCWQQPLGFDYENVWAVDIAGMNWGAEGDELKADLRYSADLLRAVQSLPEVEAAALTFNTPFSGSTWADGTWINGEETHFLWSPMSPDLPQVLKLQLAYGRWVNETDNALGYRAVVINRSFARAVFGTDDALGKEMPVFDSEGLPATPEEDAEIHRIVGVVEDIRRQGVVRESRPVMFLPVNLVDGDEQLSEILVRVHPGTTAAFEEKLVRAMQQVSPQWTFDTDLLEDRRRVQLTNYITPMLLTAVVAFFLIVMVGLGLVGVLWLSVARRTSELGLRRALGASAGSVRRQILGELWALTALAVVTGAIIYLQLPLFGANFGAGWSVFLGGAALATLVIYGFVTFCGLYPTWLATRIMPATALQYE